MGVDAILVQDMAVLEIYKELKGRHSDIVNAGNMIQGTEGSNLQSHPHQFVDELLPPRSQKPAVLLCLVTEGVLLLRQKLEVQHWVKGQGSPLMVQQDLEYGETFQRNGGFAR